MDRIIGFCQQTAAKARTTLQDFIVLSGSEKLTTDPLIRNRTAAAPWTGTKIVPHMEITGMLSCMNESPNRHGFRDSTNFACACTNKQAGAWQPACEAFEKGRERGFRARERREESVGSARGARGRNLLSLPWQASTWKKWEQERTGARPRLGFKV